MKIQPIILAAGKGTRMKSELPKVLHEVEGKPMLAHVLHTFEQVQGYMQPIVVVGYKAELVQERFPNEKFALQAEQKGTAHAVMCALHEVDRDTDAVLVVYGDQPFLESETLKTIPRMLNEGFTLINGIVEIDDFDGENGAFSAFGRIIEDAEGPVRIVEAKDCTPEEFEIRVLNAGLCVIDRQWLSGALFTIGPNAKNGEYYLVDLLARARKEGKRTGRLKMNPREAYGINSKEDLALAPSH
jgi:bifunctional UDP-N-acetylglucosamine pyrophosphorylase/glucosamine-1-phosphate N-acetyltransferase